MSRKIRKKTDQNKKVEETAHRGLFRVRNKLARSLESPSLIIQPGREMFLGLYLEIEIETEYFNILLVDIL